MIIKLMSTLAPFNQQEAVVIGSFFSFKVTTAWKHTFSITFIELHPVPDRGVMQIQKNAVSYLEREIEKLQTKVIIDKEMIIEALTNFDSLFETASNEEKKTLIRTLIKEIHVEAGRKSIKNIVFWFSEDDINTPSVLPLQEARRTVSPIRSA